MVSRCTCTRRADRRPPDYSTCNRLPPCAIGALAASDQKDHAPGGITPRAPVGGIVGDQWRRKWSAGRVDELAGVELRGDAPEVQRMTGGGGASLAVPKHLQSTLAWSQVAEPFLARADRLFSF